MTLTIERRLPCCAQVSALLLEFCLNAPSEIAALDDKGRSSFQLLQLYGSAGYVPLVFYVFDLLFLEGKDLCKQPLTARRKLLATLLSNCRSREVFASDAKCSGLFPN